MGKNLERAIKKNNLKRSDTTSVAFTIAELEAVYVLCSNGNYKKPRVQTRAVIKIREALLNAVLKTRR